METWDALQKDVEMYLAKRPGKTAVSCWLLTEKQGFSIGGKNELPSASLIKLLVLVELCEEVRRGRANLKEAISILGPAITGGDGIIKELKIGHTFTLEELATLMIIVSDNEAANQLIDRLGMKAINERAKKLGLAQTHLGRLMMADASGEKERDNWTSADDTVHLLRVICETAKTGSPLGRWMISLLARQQQEEALDAIFLTLCRLPINVEILLAWNMMQASSLENGLTYWPSLRQNSLHLMWDRKPSVWSVSFVPEPLAC